LALFEGALQLFLGLLAQREQEAAARPPVQPVDEARPGAAPRGPQLARSQRQDVLVDRQPSRLVHHGEPVIAKKYRALPRAFLPCNRGRILEGQACRPSSASGPAEFSSTPPPCPAPTAAGTSGRRRTRSPSGWPAPASASGRSCRSGRSATATRRTAPSPRSRGTLC